MTNKVHIIGGGLAGSEAAWQLAEAGVQVRLSEMRGGGEMTPAHQTDGLAELVCSNSFRSDDAENNAVGLLHAEMRALGSIIMAAGDAHRVPAGSALAVDRDGFSAAVTRAARRAPQYRDRARADRRAAGPRPDHRRDRAAHRAAAGRIDRRRDRLGRARLLRRDRADRPSRHRSTWTSAGWRAAGTRARPRITSTAR